MRARLGALALTGALALAGCGGTADDDVSAPTTGASTSTSATSAPPSTPGPTESTESTGPTEPTEPTEPTGSTGPSRRPRPEPLPFEGRRVLAISVDGLNPDALSVDATPHIWSLFERGAGTLNARTEVEATLTLPNHVGMVTGRPVLSRDGGHGVTWNTERPGATVPTAPESIFTWVAQHGGTAVTLSGKPKFEIFAQTWGADVAPVTIDTDLTSLGEAAVDVLREEQPTFTFVHLAEPDQTGHREGWLGPAYRAALGRADAVVGELLDTVRSSRALRRSVVVVLTADHGGVGEGHHDPGVRAHYTIPFVIAGRGIAQGDLYDLSPGLVDPGASRPGYDGVQPVRNCAVANVATDLLGLPPVPGSSCDVDYTLGSQAGAGLGSVG